MASGAACAAFGLLLSACASPPPPPPTVVVVVPTASTSVSAPVVENAAPTECPPDMVHIAGGPMRLGQKTLQIADYCLDQREVTAAEYGACVERGACNDEGLECDDAWTFHKPELASHPINCVSWEQASAFCREVGKRLPTFEEWEWAAQARTEERRFAWGSADPDPDQICWSNGSSRSGTCEVGQFPKSRTPQGVDDLFGNVWEWLTPRERSGVPNVSRGASWQNDSIDTLEGDNAGGFVRGFVRNDVVGFRCARGG